MTKVADFSAIRLRLASPEEISQWSFGEVTKPETINYRTQRPEKEGLFSEAIFGPTKDWECYCGKYKRIRYKGIVCDRCGVEVTKASVRRERFGHITLASPVSHIWFLRGVPSRLGLLLDLPATALEKVIYFAAYIIISIDSAALEKTKEDLDKEYKEKAKSVPKNTLKKDDVVKEQYTLAKDELKQIKVGQVLTEAQYRQLSLKYGEVFTASTGAEAVKKIVSQIDLAALERKLVKDFGEDKDKDVLQKKDVKRLRFVQGLRKANLKPEWMFLTALPVIPPDLRPMVPLDGGRYASSDLNDLYRRVINRNNRLKKLLELNAPEVIVRNEKRMLQEAVDALIDNSARKTHTVTASVAFQRRALKSLADMFKGKQGRFRQNLLGKRVDYSGRSVIVVGPELQLNQCGLPKRMALELFKPFVINKLVEREIVHNIKGASRLIDEQPDEVWAILEEIIQDKYVLLNRAPTLHRLGVQAMKPILIEGMAIKIHPLVCLAFNADFDGDQMAVHLPLTDHAQKEARELILSSRNLLKPATGDPVVSPRQDMVMGCFWLTRTRENAKGTGLSFATKNEAVVAYQNDLIDLNANVKIFIPAAKRTNPEEKFLETTVGKIFFNGTLPDGFEFVNKEMNSKALERLTAELIERFGMDITAGVLDKIKTLGFEYATKSGISWGMDDLKIHPSKKELLVQANIDSEKIQEQYERGLLTNEERYDRVIELWTKIKDKLWTLLPETIDKFGPVWTMVNSGSRGSPTQLVQMTAIKGLVYNPAGETIELPIKNSYKEGLDVLEYFISTHGARKGTADTALKTAAAGYLTRRMVDVAQDVVVRETDCKDNKGLVVKRKEAKELNASFASKIFGRYVAKDILLPAEGRKKPEVLLYAGEVIDRAKAEMIDKSGVEEVVIRSTISCKSIDGVCQKCYGYDLGFNSVVQIGAAVGIIAAQAIGEPGTQLTMKTFHTGGAAGTRDITMGLPRVEEVFEVRPPKAKAVISEVDGQVALIDKQDAMTIVKIQPSPEQKKGTKIKKSKSELIAYEIPADLTILVAEGGMVVRGTPLCEGSVDLKELYKAAGQRAVEHQIVFAIQQVYTFQGAPIHDKHIEVIVRQMFSRVKIKEVGSTNFSAGEVIEKGTFLRVNREVMKKGGSPAKAVQLLLGITKVATTTDSFLSAASFQETTRILISAAVEGKIDNLKGLKENVIIGRLIPAGTGYKRAEK